MSDDRVIPFSPPPLDPEESIRRQHAEAARLACLTPGEWQLWIEGSAAQLGIPRSVLEASVKAIIAEQEKTKRARKAEEERDRRRSEKAAAAKKKEKQRAFKILDSLPEAEQEKRLEEIAKRLDEDPATVREEFETSSPQPVDSKPELWPEAVETAKLLQDLIDQIKRFIVVHEDGAVAVALWTMLAWIHDAVATHSPVLVVTSAEPDSGKTTLLGVLAQLNPNPLSGAELTGPALFRIVDRHHPTLIIDEADDIFHSKNDLRHIINSSWVRGTKIPRTLPGQSGVHLFDPFCPKIIGLKGMYMPSTTASRAIVIKLWPALPEETMEDFAFIDAAEFVELRRKLLRWSADNAVALADSKPAFPPGFRNRLAANWRLLLAIADHAGGPWSQRSRQAAITLSRKPAVASEGLRLLAALREIFINRDTITSAEIVQQLTADSSSEWCAYRGRGRITQWQLAALLSAYEIHSVVLHPTKRSDLSRAGYRASQFADAFARFLTPNTQTQKVK
jgi:putative DNA primase/helicase